MICCLDEVLEQAIRFGPFRVAIAGAADEAALSAIALAHAKGLARGLAFGSRAQVEAILSSIGADASCLESIEDESDDQVCCRLAVEAVRSGAADLLLKGKVKTATLLRAVLDADTGLRTGRLLSDVFVFENPRREPNHLQMITDGGVTIRPDLEQKVQIIQNAVEVAQALGNPQPKVALLSAVETVTPAIPSTQEAAILAQMWRRGQIRGCILDGPLALDNAVSAEAAKIKGIDSPVAGDADILVCPDIESANMLAKSTTYFAGFRLAHVIVGARAPVLIPSRSDTADAKLMSVALGSLVLARQRGL
ncbi:MAG: bifunctional enoyl-CoA hydratase/phosphate acetyltransferase [candidate division KSB1 bacterium]|nr:bifunctional enoyl-CoA hydratase/phosphate acetyltransferase [candidate division KSB1 bacterium]